MSEFENEQEQEKSLGNQPEDYTVSDDYNTSDDYAEIVSGSEKIEDVKKEIPKTGKKNKGPKRQGTVYRMMMFLIAVFTMCTVVYGVHLIKKMDSDEQQQQIIAEVDNEKLDTDEDDNVSGGVLDTGEINDGDLTLEQIQAMSNNDIIDTYLISKTNAKRHDYDVKNFNQDSDFWFYEEDGKKTSKLGIDVSSYQKDIDWKKVKKAGVDFAIIRAGIRGYGSGKLVEDEKFKQNIKGAKAAGIDVGVYFFSQSITVEEAKEEAEFVYNLIKNYDLEYPVVYDTENITSSSARTNKAGLSANDRTDMAIAFCDYFESRGYDSMIYSNKRWFLRNMNLEKLDNYDIWLAQYSSELDYPFHFGMWQYTSSGKIPGIEGNVDVDIDMPE